MKKLIYLLFFSVILFGCQKDEIFIIENTEVINQPNDTDNTDIDETITFNLNSEQYNSINQTTSHYSTQNTYRYISYDDIINNLNVRQTNPEVYWHTSARHFVVDDFDKNGTLDVFGFWFKSTPNYHGHIEPGKYFLYLDYFSDNPKSPLSWDTEIVYMSEVILSDIDGDNNNEIISFSDNNHDVRVAEDDISISSKPIEIVTLDSNLNLTKKYVGTESKSHNGSLGDVDNDGDVDIVYFPFGDNNNKFPLLFKNDGIGNFTSEDLFINQSLKTEYSNFNALTYEVFDINKDGNLDIIINNRINLKRDPYDTPATYEELNQNIQIVWGDGSGNFDINNKIVFNVSDNFGYTISVLGYGFSDYDNDGDYDIFLTTTRSEEWRLLGISDVTTAVNSGMFYNNYILYAFENNDNKFNDISDNIFDYRKDMTLTKYSNFYSLYSMDIDNDGDYDLVPGMNHSWTEYRQLNLLYWEKNGSTYTKKEIQ